MYDDQWWRRSRCLEKWVDLGWFHPDKGGKAEPALKVCRACPVARPCLEETLQQEAARSGNPIGVRGAMTAKQRAPIVRQRKKAAEKRESLVLQRVRRMAAAGMDDNEIGRQVGSKPKAVEALRRRHRVPAGQPAGDRLARQKVGGGVR